MAPSDDFGSSTVVNTPSENDSLLYCSSVSPRPTAAGELLIYRHLTRLKSHRVFPVVPEDKPPGELQNLVEQVLVPRASIWLWRLRRGGLFSVADRLLARHVRREFDAMARRARPSAVLTVFLPDPFMAAAASFAHSQRLPLILICHDDYEDTVPPSFRPNLARVYCQAAARLCVSEPMTQEFERRYGVSGKVLYPIPSGPARTPLAQTPDAQLRVGFAGSIGDGYEEPLVRLADAVHSVKGRIVIVSPTSRDRLRGVWSHPAVIDLGQVTPDKVREIFHQAAVNVLTVVQSFDRWDERAYGLNFPSKLTEYTTFGLPLLIVAPQSASAVRWAKRHERAAIVATDLSSGLTNAVDRLTNSDARAELAQGLRDAAEEFAPERLQTIFSDSLKSVISPLLPSPAK